MFLFLDHSHCSARSRGHSGRSLSVPEGILVAEELLWSGGSPLPDTPYLPGAIQVRQLVTTKHWLAVDVTGEEGSETSGSEPQGESFLGAKAIRGEVNVDSTGVGEEGRRGRLSPTKGPQISRRSVNLPNSKQGLQRGFFFF